MSWNNLPSELSQVIFSYLTRKELVQCQLTCFGWSRQAQQALYKDVQIESSHQLFSFINAISTSNMQPGHYLRKLYLNCCFDHELTNNTLDILTKHSASIEHLQLITASDLFWHRLIQERKKGQWKHLRMVDFPLSRSQLKLYYEAMIVMQDTVESLMICDSFFLDYPTVNLHIFVRAKKLTLIKSTQMPLRELSQVVDVLPQLTDLTVKSSPQFPDVHHLSDHDHQALSWTPSKLVRLQTNLFQCSNETFLYMMEKFPNLMDFSIDFFSHPVSATPCLDLEVMKRFADYVCRLETFRVRQLVSENLADIIVLMIKQLKKRHVKFNVSVDVHSNQTRFRELYICYKKKEINSLCKPEVNLCIKNKNRLLPLASILQTIGSFVTSLRIYNVGTSLICFVPKQAEYHQVVDHHYLSDILEQCPQLTRLKLNRVRLIASDFEGHHLLDTLVLNRCVYSPLILYQLSKQLPNLKHMIISCSEIMDTCTLNPITTASFFHINMPYTSFDTFEFTRLSSRIVHQYMFLKLSTSQQTLFFKCDKKTSMQATEQEYSDSMHIHTAHTIHIHCKSIAHLQLSDFGHQISYTVTS